MDINRKGLFRAACWRDDLSKAVQEERDRVVLNTEDLSYARCAKTRAGRAVVRVIENMTGRRKLIRKIANYQADLAEGRDFWQVMWERFNLRLDMPGRGLENIPAEGPIVCVANHPFGIVDGLAFGMVLGQRRPGFKILANAWLAPAPEIVHHILPIERDPTREAMKTNIETRRTALNVLKAGGCVGVFPAGSVSAGRRIYKNRAFDSNWKTFTATMIGMSKATVVPMFFEGQNSRAFQIASHLGPTLRLSLFINEFDNQVGETIRLVVGDPIPYEELAQRKLKPEEMMAYLRRRTYSLSPEFFDSLTEGKAWSSTGESARSY